MSNVNGSGHNEVRWRPRQEASLAPPCSTVRSLGNKCTVGEESICDIAGTFRRSPSDLTPGELCSPCPPSLRPCDGCYCNNYDLQNFKCQLLLPRGEILIRSPMFAQRAVTGLSDVSGRSFIRSWSRTVVTKFSIEVLYVCSGWLDIVKFYKNSIDL